MNGSWNAHSLEEVYARMVRSGADFVVVGGQAVNLWTESSQGSPVLSPQVWETLQPFASRDLDCLGGSLDAWKVGQAFGVQPRVYASLGKVWVPTAAELDLPVPGTEETLLVEFLHTLKGVGSSEVEETARELS